MNQDSSFISQDVVLQCQICSQLFTSMDAFQSASHVCLVDGIEIQHEPGLNNDVDNEVNPDDADGEIVANELNEVNPNDACNQGICQKR